MTFPCPHCGVDVQIEMTQLGPTEEIGPAGLMPNSSAKRRLKSAPENPDAR